MATVVSVGTPLAEALSNVIQPKLVEMGWSSDGGEDSALTEYVILMLVNGKTQEQIAGELSNDLLGLGEGDTQALDFSRWLFEQVETLNRQINGGGAGATTSEQDASAQAIPSFSGQEGAGAAVHAAALDGASRDENGDSVVPGESIPTGPKAMRNGRQGGRGRILNQINRAMDRGPDAALHRIRGQPGAGRINTHGRDHMRGPRPYQNGGARTGPGRQPGGMQMPPGSTAANMMQMSQQDQMHLMALLEEQARMMAQFMPGFVPPAINPAFQQQNSQQGRSLFERVERHGPRPHGSFSQRAAQHGISVQSPRGETTTVTDKEAKPEHAPTEGEQQDESDTNAVCRWNLRCTRKDCPFAHQSPAAPEGNPIDVNDHCPFGAACKNKKCTARHPSPAVKIAHQAEEICKFFPHCANPNCHFKHPDMPLCRSGADCSAPGCKFTHLQIPCKFHPCLNRNCPYKHVEGQKGAFADKVWTAESAERKEKPHLSERKFVADENAPEELIKPSATPTEGTQSQELVA